MMPSKIIYNTQPSHIHVFAQKIFPNFLEDLCQYLPQYHRVITARILVLLMTVGCLQAMTHSGHCQVVWLKSSVDLAAAPDAAPTTVLEARFPFENTGKTPVDFSTLQSDCGCTIPEMVKRHYNPGESGEVLARITLGAIVGRAEKHLAVGISGEKEPTILTLVLSKPELLLIKPMFAEWKIGSSASPVKMDLTAAPGVTIRDLAVSSSQQLFTPNLRLLKEGQHYELTVTPSRVDLPLTAQILLSGDFVLQTPRPDGKNPQQLSHRNILTIPVSVR